MGIHGLYLGSIIGIIFSNIWNFYCVFIKYNWEEVKKKLQNYTIKDKSANFSDEKETEPFLDDK